MTSIRRLLPLIFLALGCGKPAGAFCVSDDECDPLHCFAGTCQELEFPSDTKGVVFEVQPLPGLGIPPDFFHLPAPPKGSQKPSQPLSFTFCAASGVAGEFDGEGPAEVAIEGRPIALGSRTDAWVESFVSPFRIPLAPGAWKLTFFLPEQEGVLPPPVVREVNVSRCGITGMGRVRADGPTREARVRIVVDEERDPRPRCGVSIRLVDPSTRNPLSRTLRLEQPRAADGGPSGPCEMPAEGWALPFRSPKEPLVEVQIRSLDPSQPTLYHSDRLVSIPGTGGVDLGTIGVQGAENSLEAVRVRLEGPTGKPVPGARIQLSSSASGEVDPSVVRWTRPLEARAIEGEPGGYELWALPGTYTVRIEPAWADEGVGALSCLAPEGRPGSCWATIEVVSGGPNAFEARLPRRVVLSGKVIPPEPGLPVQDVRITALPLDGGRRFSTRTDVGGRYELSLDPGSYELLVQPHGTDAAWTRVSFDGEGPLIVDRTKNVYLSKPARMAGYVAAGRDRKGIPLGHSYLRAWRLQGELEPLWIGEAVADSQGRFAIVLPAD